MNNVHVEYEYVSVVICLTMSYNITNKKERRLHQPEGEVSMKDTTGRVKNAYKMFIGSYDYVSRKRGYIVNGFVVNKEGINNLRKEYHDKLRDFVNDNLLQLNQTIKKYIREYEAFFEEEK